ncbi:MAG: hypothetical protein QXS21_03525 [Thermoproteota archaeon]|nr:hypothetical protein [Candidatus Brockarchaeota archaeon]MBO3763051.1 hypothetical protein [Candidatus Brockarchaeota archaeon]MBO3768210.1 hypothetical protein [Candidatus Brockarchaeota archaeon]MBO3801261.1 hypothetical protein [Candidatus Brockarchaeota archaeon]
MESKWQLDFLILDTIASVKRGLGVNELSRILSGKVSKVKLIEEIKKLREEGLIKVKKDPKHKQRSLIVVDEKILEAFDNVKINGGTVRDIGNLSEKLRSYIVTCSSYISTITNPIVKKYATYRLLRQFSEIMVSILGVKGEFDF